MLIITLTNEFSLGSTTLEGDDQRLILRFQTTRFLKRKPHSCLLHKMSAVSSESVTAWLARAGACVLFGAATSVVTLLAGLFGASTGEALKSRVKAASGNYEGFAMVLGPLALASGVAGAAVSWYTAEWWMACCIVLLGDLALFGTFAWIGATSSRSVFGQG